MKVRKIITVTWETLAVGKEARKTGRDGIPTHACAIALLFLYQQAIELSGPLGAGNYECMFIPYEAGERNDILEY